MNRKGCGTFDLLIGLLILAVLVAGGWIVNAGGTPGPVGAALFRQGICLGGLLVGLVVIVVGLHGLRYGGRGR